MAENQLYAVVVGCGHLGSRVASHLSAAGHEVVVIETNPSAWSLLSPQYSGYRIDGDGADSEVLDRAKLSEATLAVFATDDDNLNLLLGLRSRYLYHVPRVVVRLGDPSKKPTFADDGMEIVCPNDLLGKLLVHRILSNSQNEEGLE